MTPQKPASTAAESHADGTGEARLPAPAICRDDRDSPQDVTYQEAILDGANPMEGFYDN